MKCPECIETGQTSRVYDNGTLCHLMGWQAYYDEDGEYHAHDPNHPRTSYKCSNGHYFSLTRKNRCPSGTCDYGKE